MSPRLGAGQPAQLKAEAPYLREQAPYLNAAISRLTQCNACPAGPRAEAEAWVDTSSLLRSTEVHTLQTKTPIQHSTSPVLGIFHPPVPAETL